jgi:hypothetical protein
MPHLPNHGLELANSRPVLAKQLGGGCSDAQGFTLCQVHRSGVAIKYKA